MSPRGKILSVEDGGSVWLMFYQVENCGIGRVVFDWRQLSNFYEVVSGHSFYHDYKFGVGRDIIKDYFKGKTLVIEGDEWDQRVGLED